jgi:hypothetical protein
MNKYLTRMITIILTNDVDARDDWMSTIKQVHDKEMVIWYYDKSQYYDAFFSNKLSNVHTIKRLWQLVQEKNPELRGETWEERQRQGGMIAKEMVEEKFYQLSLFNDI